MEIKLLPCPFCGGDMPFMNAEDADEELSGFFWVACGCGAQGANGKTKAEASRLWNQRAKEGE